MIGSAEVLGAPKPVPAESVPAAPLERQGRQTMPRLRAATPGIPLWMMPARPGGNVLLYFVGGAAALVIAMILLSAFNFIQLPWSGNASTSSAAATPVVGLPALTARSESARADRFLDQTLAPALLPVNRTLPALRSCLNGGLSSGCFNALTATDQQLKIALSVIDHADIPLCLSTPATKYRADFNGLDLGLQQSLAGYQDGQAKEVNVGMNTYSGYEVALAADTRALGVARKSCDTQVVGP